MTDLQVPGGWYVLHWPDGTSLAWTETDAATYGEAWGDVVQAAAREVAEPASDDDEHLGWWTIHGGDLLRGLRRVARGEDPDAVYAEMYANSDHEYPDAGEDR